MKTFSIKKEEIKKNVGNNIQAFDLGFRRSVITILDANITTLIASIILNPILCRLLLLFGPGFPKPTNKSI